MTGSLIVPIEVDALVVNTATRLLNFQRWTMDFAGMAGYASVEPPPFSDVADFSSDPSNDGVYLSWTLPSGLREGTHDLAAGTTSFLNVPNRWLVVRYNGPAAQRSATAWIVVSDFLDPNQGTSPYVDPRTGEPTQIGTNVELGTQPWVDTGAGPPFLTAVGPGLPTFAGFQPYNENVFSIHDPLTGVADTDTLSYLVVGWYTAWGGDPLATGDFGATIDGLGWTIDEQQTASQTILCGRALGVSWSKAGQPPDPQRPPASGVTMAVGNTSIDALTALIAQQAADDPTIDAELLEAFQYGLLDRLDAVDGRADLARRAHDASFGSATAGGYAWHIDDDPSADAPPVDAAELAKEETWLVALNAAQRAYDQAVRQLAADRWQLYAYWWMNGVAAQLPKPPTDVDLTELAAQLDPSNTTGLAYGVSQQAAALAKLVTDGTIPSGASQDDLQSSIDAYAHTQGLPAGRVLKRAALAPFALVNDPVVLLTRTGSSALADPAATVACRFADEVLTALKWSGGTIEAASVEAAVPAPNLANLPAVTQSLLTEFFLLDPANATLIANAIGSPDQTTIDAIATAAGAPAANAVPPKPPPFGFARWEQPWQPLYLLWEANYWPIAHDVTGAATWEFDGTHYAWNGTGAGSSLSFAGRSLLTPQAVFNFQAQLDRYEKTHPDPDLDLIAKFIASTDEWDVLSQALDGFGTMLAVRDTSARLAPPPSVIALVQDEDRAAPAPSDPYKEPFEGWPPSAFQPYRSGQIGFTRVMVVDRFGQTIEVVTDQNNMQVTPIIAPGLQATKKVDTLLPVAQLPQRPLQPARLDFDLVDAVDDAKVVGLDVGANPVCSWVLRNYVDGSLLFFDAAGANLGEMRIVTDATDTSTAWWTATPGSPYASVESLQSDFPQLCDFLTRFSANGAQGAADFDTLVAVIDSTLPLIDPPGGDYDESIAVLVGRPLALVRARALLDLDGPPLPDPSWQYVLQPQTPAFPSYGFPIRLGDLARVGDGLVGYFTDGNYSRLNAVFVPTTAGTPYAAQIGGKAGNYLTLDFGASSTADLTLLMDPRAPVHAVTDILPTSTLSLPAAFVSGPLSALSVTFRVGPLLTTDTTTKTGHALAMPLPSTHRGTWSWTDGDGSSLQVAAAAPGASLPVSPTVRSGWLDLSDAEQ